MRRKGRRRRSRKRTDTSRSEEQRRTGRRRMPNKLFIGNLGKVTKRELEAECGRFGRLQDVWISQKPSGFAFVEFLNSKDASACVQALDGRYVLGSRLRVEFAKSEPPGHPQRRSKRGERASSQSPLRSRRSSPSKKGLGDLMLGSSARLLPPPKPTSSMLAPVYERSPSPLVLLRRGSGGLLYEDPLVYRSWDDSARLSRISSSVLLPSVRDRSRSPRPRSPLPLPVVDRDLLSPSGRLLAPPLPSVSGSYATAGYVGSRGEYTPPHIRSRDRTAVRYKSRSPLPAHSRSRSPLRARSGDRERVRTRSASRSPRTMIAQRPRERLLGKTPPLPSCSQSSSPQRYDQKGQEAPVAKCQRERSRSPLAYSSRKIAKAYTPPSPSAQPKTRNSYEKKYSVSPVRKRNSPPPKAYALSSDKQSPRWSRSCSRSVDRKHSSRSPVRRMESRSSSSTSPPHYGRSPGAREICPPVAVKREAVSPGDGQMKALQTRKTPVSKHSRSPLQRYRHSRSPSNHSRSPKVSKGEKSPMAEVSKRERCPMPEVSKRDRCPMHNRANSPAVHRQSPGHHGHTSRRNASPEMGYSKQGSYRTAGSSPVNRKRSPASLAKNGRSPSRHSHVMTRSDTVHSSAGGRQVESPPSRDRHSPRRRR